MKKTFKSLLILFSLLLSSCSIFKPIVVDDPKEDENTKEETKQDDKKDDSTIELPTSNVIIHTNEKVDIEGSGNANINASDVVDAVADSVVEIVTETITESRWYGTQVSSAAGSGVILDSQGYIITNHHVIDEADSVSVTTRNGKTYKATIIGSDEESDIAVLYINPNGDELTYAVLGDSSKIRVASDCLVIGNPLGSLGGSVTKGIISALDRLIQFDDYTMKLLQIDAAVNPGNSGGALFDMNGYLIGIVNAKSTGEEIDGIGFAIPSNDAIEVFEDLCNYGYVRGRTSLGIDLAYTYVRGNSFRTYYGVFVITENTTYNLPVAAYIYKIDDVIVETMAEIYAVIRTKNIGDTVVLTYYESISATSSKTVTVTLIEQTK